MSSMATRVLGSDGQVRAILIIAGPMSRLTEERMVALVPALQSTADELSEASSVSPMFQRPLGVAGTSSGVLQKHSHN
jgi:IclR family transcriptional regulator, acetate operon repressor